MNVKRNIRIATATALACAGLSAGISTPAVAYSPVPTLSSGTVQPTTAKRLTWRECWSTTYAMARDRGHSIQYAEADADLTCGKTQDEF